MNQLYTIKAILGNITASVPAHLIALADDAHTFGHLTGPESLVFVRAVGTVDVELTIEAGNDEEASERLTSLVSVARSFGHLTDSTTVTVVTIEPVTVPDSETTQPVSVDDLTDRERALIAAFRSGQL